MQPRLPKSRIVHYYKTCDRCDYKGSTFEIDYQHTRLNLCLMCEEVATIDSEYDAELLEIILARKLLKDLG